MGLLIDGIIGPILETFGVIEIDSEGEWTRIEKKPKGSHQKKVRENKENLWERFVKWFQNIVSQIKSEIEKNRTTEENHHVGPERIPERLNDVASELANDIVKERVKGITGKRLRKISKFEGQALASTGNYKIWYGDCFPDDSEVEEGIIYVVKGQGDTIAYSGPLAGIRQDAYYVLDNTKKTMIDSRTGEINTWHDDTTKDYYKYKFKGINAFEPNWIVYPRLGTTEKSNG